MSSLSVFRVLRFSRGFYKRDANGGLIRRGYSQDVAVGQRGQSKTTVKLVLMRHGQSRWNAEARFTGWADIGLSSVGENEAVQAGAALRELGFELDRCYTSMLKRSVRSAWILLGEMGQHWVPVHSSWALNERHYGALTGMSKPEAMEKLGDAEVSRWRRTWTARPPAIEADHPLFQQLVDRRYSSRHGQTRGANGDTNGSQSGDRSTATTTLQRRRGAGGEKAAAEAAAAAGAPVKKEEEEEEAVYHEQAREQSAAPNATAQLLPSSESLRDVSARVLSFWDSDVAPALLRGEHVLVVAHAHTLRALVKHLDVIGDSEIEELTIPTGTPLVYSLDSETLQPVRRRAMAGLNTSHDQVGVDSLTASSPLVTMDDAPLVAPLGTISPDSMTHAIEDKPYTPIAICNRTWRVLSGPEVIENAEVMANFRHVAEEGNYGGTSNIFLSENLLQSMTRKTEGSQAAAAGDAEAEDFPVK